MVTGTMMDKIGLVPILSIILPVTIDTMLNFDGDIDGHGGSEVTCKQTLSFVLTSSSKIIHQLLCCFNKTENTHVTKFFYFQCTKNIIEVKVE